MLIISENSNNMKFPVKRKHIRRAQKIGYQEVHSKNCPIALAAREHSRKGYVRIGIDTGWIGNTIYNIPLALRKIIRKFDHTGKMDPFTVELTPWR